MRHQIASVIEHHIRRAKFGHNVIEKTRISPGSNSDRNLILFKFLARFDDIDSDDLCEWPRCRFHSCSDRPDRNRFQGTPSDGLRNVQNDPRRSESNGSTLWIIRCSLVRNSAHRLMLILYIERTVFAQRLGQLAHD